MDLVPTQAIPKINIRACVRYTDWEKFIPIIAAVCKIIVPITAIFLPQRSEMRGMKVAEKVHPMKKLIPIKAIFAFDAPMKFILVNVYMLSRAVYTNSSEM